MALAPLDEVELAFLRELRGRGVRFVVIGMGAAVLQGATAVTQDLDLWFEDPTDARIAEAARAVGGLYVSGSFGMQPPTIGGALGDRFDVVTHAHGLGRFEDELPETRTVDLQGIQVQILALERILASKRALGRPKDLAQVPVLEAAIAVRDERAREE
jgi:predicted nucleotidyltransferase